MFAISISIPPIAITWLVLSPLIGWLALAKRRSFVRWMLASILLTPLAAIVLLFLPAAKKAAPGNQTKPTVIPPPRPKSPSLIRRVAGATGFRVKESRAAKALASATGAAHRSLEDFANRAELDSEIAKTVQSRFGRDKS
jgi:hypothetical protein